MPLSSEPTNITQSGLVQRRFSSLFPTSCFPGRVMTNFMKTTYLGELFAFCFSSCFICRSRFFYDQNILRRRVLTLCSSARLFFMDTTALNQPEWAHQRLVWRSKPIYLPPKKIIHIYCQSSLSNTNPRSRNPCINLPYLQKMQNASIGLG